MLLFALVDCRLFGMSRQPSQASAHKKRLDQIQPLSFSDVSTAEKYLCRAY